MVEDRIGVALDEGEAEVEGAAEVVVLEATEGVEDDDDDEDEDEELLYWAALEVMIGGGLETAEELVVAMLVLDAALGLSALEVVEAPAMTPTPSWPLGVAGPPTTPIPSLLGGAAAVVAARARKATARARLSLMVVGDAAGRRGRERREGEWC